VNILTRKVAIVAGGVTYFSKARKDKTQEELVAEAMRMALYENDINMTKDDIEGSVIGYFSDHFENQLKFGAIIQDYLGLNPKSNVRIEGGGATGGLAIREGYAQVASGLLDVVAVIGFEKMSEVNTAKGNEFIALASDTDWDFPIGGYYSGYYALMARRHMEEFGTTEEQMAMVAVKNRNNAQYNRFAQTNPKMNPFGMRDGGFIKVEDVLKSPYVAYPLKRLDICLMSDGASVAILASEEKAKK
jgi:Acetyl-CoA acetyltransferase